MPNKPKRQKRKLSERERKSNRQRDIERNLDEALEETFPASDPVAATDPVVDVLKGRRKNNQRTKE
jgi:hypothetical protein